VGVAHHRNYRNGRWLGHFFQIEPARVFPLAPRSRQATPHLRPFPIRTGASTPLWAIVLELELIQPHMAQKPLSFRALPVIHRRLGREEGKEEPAIVCCLDGRGVPNAKPPNARGFLYRSHVATRTACRSAYHCPAPSPQSDLGGGVTSARGAWAVRLSNQTYSLRCAPAPCGVRV